MRVEMQLLDIGAAKEACHPVPISLAAAGSASPGDDYSSRLSRGKQPVSTLTRHGCLIKEHHQKNKKVNEMSNADQKSMDWVTHKYGDKIFRDYVTALDAHDAPCPEEKVAILETVIQRHVPAPSTANINRFKLKSWHVPGKFVLK